MTLQQQLESLREPSRWDLPESEIDAQIAAARAQFEAIAEKIESQTPRHC